ncbi:PEP/pyruvate-binding domain-containing protein [Thermodesulfobacteriota bacterium]
MPSKALEVNIESSKVDVKIREEYILLREVMSRYPGILENLNVFITELCHPYKNWKFIVKEARSYSLDYFHLLVEQNKGPDAAKIFINIFLDSIKASSDEQIKRDGADNLLIYVQKIIIDSKKELKNFIPVISYCFDEIISLDKKYFSFFVKSFYQINKISALMLKTDLPDIDYKPVNNILVKYLEDSYTYWINYKDPETWFISEANIYSAQQNVIRTIFKQISHAQLNRYRESLRTFVREKKDEKGLLAELVKLPGFRQISDRYRDIPRLLFSEGEKAGRGYYWKLIFLFHTMNIEGLSAIHEETLREINRTLTWLIDIKKLKDQQELILKTFSILKECVLLYPETALNCIRKMGMAIYRTNESDLVDFFLESVLDLGFQAPDFQGVGNDWQARVNSSHIQNIRTWMEIIELNPTWSKKLLSSLIIYLSLEGVYIRDTDLFPRDITKFLNSDISNVYNLAKQLTRLFPAYFNDIGAEGELRDTSTRLDEICFRKDVLVHFLRKQSHVESSNRIIGLMEAVLNFWLTKETGELKEFLPPDIFRQIEKTGPYIDGVHILLNDLFKARSLNDVKDLLEDQKLNLDTFLKQAKKLNQTDRERLKLAVSLYRLLVKKYSIEFLEIDSFANQLQPGTFPDINQLKTALKEEKTHNKISGILSYLEILKSTIISKEQYDIREDIYHKRHFTVDIPSMYGSYHETKFDALGLTFRLESLANVLFDKLVEDFDLGLITRDTIYKINNYLILFNRAFLLDGLLSSEIEKQLDLLGRSLEVTGFSFTQFIDIFKGFSQAVGNIVNDYFNAVHEQNLIKILNRIPNGSLLPKYKRSNGKTHNDDNLTHMVSEVFLRERISFALGLQQFDIFLSRIMKTLFRQSDKLPKEKLRLLLNYDPQKTISSINSGNKLASGVVHLGNKGLNLVRLNKYGFNVPPGFIVTTEVFRHWEIIQEYRPAEKNLKDQLIREITIIEKQTGKSLGDPDNPLLFSVRSGAPISQPGMMDTFLNVGINEEVVEGIVKRTGEKWFAWDCYRRFLQSYGMAFGLDRNDFDDIIADIKKTLNVPRKINLTGGQMKEIALEYKKFIVENTISIEESPLEQMYITIGKVLQSWNTVKAKAYRNIMKISDDWGTAVTIQSMVFGNLDRNSGSGVVFTHNPRLSGDIITLWGDYALGNQGEDVVSGLVNTLPISNRQAEAENRDIKSTLQNSFPNIYNAIRNCAKDLIYERNWSPQEMEFTFESGNENDLYFLQTRDMAIRQSKKVLSFVTDHMTDSKFLGHGIGVSGGAMSGKVVFNLREIRDFRKREPETPLILVRGDTVPDDIQEIFESDGLLTARGGSTSHASIVAHRLGKTCVVGSPNLVCMEKDSRFAIDRVQLKSGDWLSIDGREGSIYSGKMEIEEVARR